MSIRRHLTNSIQSIHWMQSFGMKCSMLFVVVAITWNFSERKKTHATPNTAFEKPRKVKETPVTMQFPPIGRSGLRMKSQSQSFFYTSLDSRWHLGSIKKLIQKLHKKPTAKIGLPIIYYRYRGKFSMNIEKTKQSVSDFTTVGLECGIPWNMLRSSGK